jgi:putative flavoprotein involved in K+ transport
VITAKEESMSTNTRNLQLVEPGNALMQLVATPVATTSARTTQRVAPRAGSQHYDVIVIGGGQAGLSVGYYLKQRGLRFLIVDGSERIGDAWRKRWHSLKLFTPAWLSSLDGLPMPLPRTEFPTKDQMADYLESYAAHFDLPVRSCTRVDKLSRKDGRFHLACGDVELTADQVVIAMASFQKPRVPELARALRGDIVQFHSSAYQCPEQLREGSVLVVGGGNSAAEIALELSRTHRVRMAGRPSGEVPFKMGSFLGRHVFARLLMRVLFHRVLTIDTPMGRKARPKMRVMATPLIRTQTKELVAAGVEHLPLRVTDVRDGLPVLEDGSVLDVQNVVWSTGYEAGQSFIDLPIFDAEGQLVHEAGVVTQEPGLYFVGLPFLYSMSSAMIHGVGRDAARIASEVAARAEATVHAA